MKNRIRITESDLHRIIKESVNRVLNEVSTDTLHNAYQKSQKLTMKMPNLSSWKVSRAASTSGVG